MKKALLLLCLLYYAGMAQKREFTIATYNSLRYSPTNIDGRHPYFRQIIDSINPDILVMQELAGSPAAIMFMDSVLNMDSLRYSIAIFVDGPDSDIALYYKPGKFRVAPTLTYSTSLRDIYHFKLLPAYAEDTLHIFGVHLKASSGSSNETRREGEVNVLRAITDQFADSTNFLVCGDFNIYKATEPAYQKLIADTPGKDGNFVDILQMPGNWNNASYALHHTQSPRTTQFNGGAHGGMDDRFDMILMSHELKSSSGIGYKPGSMYVFGNDGLHYNKAIIDAPNNNQYDLNIRTALHQASDHLPVVASFVYKPQYFNTKELQTRGVEIYYSQQGKVTLSNIQNLPLEVAVYNTQGQLVKQWHTTQSEELKLNKGIYVVHATHQGQTLLLEKIIN